MSSKYTTRLVVALVVIASLLAACNPAAPTAQPTADQAAIEEAVKAAQTQAAETVVAQITQDALDNPSPTPTAPPPTEAPTATQYVVPTNTSAPVVVPTRAPATAVVPTNTPTPKNFACEITALSPKDNSELSKGEDFDLNVTFKNTGTKNWDAGDIDFHYVEGTKFQKSVNALDISATTKPGETVKFIVDMLAPSDSGTFYTTWSLAGGGAGNFCTLKLNIKVR